MKPERQTCADNSLTRAVSFSLDPPPFPRDGAEVREGAGLVVVLLVIDDLLVGPCIPEKH